MGPFILEKSVVLTHPSKVLTGRIALPGSKSESNRALILQALSQRGRISGLSHAEDTVILQRLLGLWAQGTLIDPTAVRVLDAGAAGTVMRFMTALLSLGEGAFILTGSERMLHRPIGILVEALKALGADIQYLKQSGYPPLRITGRLLSEKEITISGGTSSQYVSALLLIAPFLPNGLVVHLEGELISRPYVTMTLAMMALWGYPSEWMDGRIVVSPSTNFEIDGPDVAIEPDWSAASYWFAMVALADKADVLLPGLRQKSLQGDKKIIDLMRPLGVLATFTPEGLRLEKSDVRPTDGPIDFSSCPDLAQTVITVYAALRIAAQFTGMKTLTIKETNRITALQAELQKIGAFLHNRDPFYNLTFATEPMPNNVLFATYQDHRMAMALAPVALMGTEVAFDEAKVVDKSYPHFWTDLAAAGFNVN